jgi:predicted transcriptional regulator
MLVPISEASIQSRYHKSTIMQYIHQKKVRGVISPYKTLVSLDDLMDLRMTKKPRKKSYTNEQKDKVISLFLAGGDNRNKTIGDKVGLSAQTVNNILNKYYESNNIHKQL